MLVGMLVKPCSSPSITYMSVPTITTMVTMPPRKTVIFRRLARSAVTSCWASPRNSAQLEDPEHAQQADAANDQQRVRPGHDQRKVGRQDRQQVHDAEEAAGVAPADDRPRTSRSAYSTVNETVKIHSTRPKHGTVLAPDVGNALQHHGDDAHEDRDQQADVEGPARGGVGLEDDLVESGPHAGDLRVGVRHRDCYGTAAFFFASATRALARLSASLTMPAALASVSLRSRSAASFAPTCARGPSLFATSESACR